MPANLRDTHPTDNTMNTRNLRGAAVPAIALAFHAAALAGDPAVAFPGLEGAGAPADLSATIVHSQFPGSEDVDALAAKDTKGGYVHRFDDLVFDVDSDGNIEGIATLRVLDGEEIVDERDIALDGKFHCNFKGEEHVSLAEAKGVPENLSVRLKNTIKANAKLSGKTKGGGKPWMANLPLKQSFTRTTVDGVVTEEEGDSSFTGKLTTKAGDFGNGRADVTIDGWNPGQIQFGFTEGSSQPFGNGDGKWRTDCVVQTDADPDPIDGGSLQIIASFRNAGSDRNGKATMNGRNDKFKVNAQGIVTTNGEEASEAGFGPEDMEFFPTKTLVIGPASQSLVQTTWGEDIIEQSED